MKSTSVQKNNPKFPVFRLNKNDKCVDLGAMNIAYFQNLKFVFFVSLEYNEFELIIACRLNSILFTPKIIVLNLLKFTTLILKFSKKKKLVTMELVLHLWFSNSVLTRLCANTMVTYTDTLIGIHEARFDAVNASFCNPDPPILVTDYLVGAYTTA
jgi:hypothetical protein